MTVYIVLFGVVWLVGIILMPSVDNVIGRGARIVDATNIYALGRPVGCGGKAIKAGGGSGQQGLQDIRC